MFELSKSSKNRRKNIDPRLIAISDLAIKITLVDFGHPQYAGFRTGEEQMKLFTDGKSMADGINTLSDHQLGKALDFYAYVDGKASWEPAHLAMVACAFYQSASNLGFKIEWGGLWTYKKPMFVNGIPYGWDMPHVKLVGDL